MCRVVCSGCCSPAFRAGSRGMSGALIVACVLGLSVPAEARNTIRDAFFSAYPSAVGTRLDNLPSRATHCGVCHYRFSGGGPRNPYGARIEAVLPNFPNNAAGRVQAILSLAGEDSEFDGFANSIEILDQTNYSNTPTFPGLSAANVSLISAITLSDVTPYVTPVAAVDTTPPFVQVIGPNGGETLIGNGASMVTWTATDAGGIAKIDVYLSIDDGETWDPLALTLDNTGSAAVFAPNRPSTLARIRVVATDNSGNAGQDDSDARFAVARPAGGIAPTTLRDFDHPGTLPLTVTALETPTDCSMCHGNYDPPVEPYRNWAGSMMAHAARDPLFEACMAVGNQDAPDSGDMCLKCHIPAAWLDGRSVPTDGSQVRPEDKFGVACDLCHRLVDPIASPENPAEDAAILAALALPPVEFGNGQFVVDPTRIRRGPFADAVAPHEFIVSPFHREAALCGTCHDVSNPAFEKNVDGRYVPNAFDEPAANFSAHHLMPIERTYSEWLNSAYNSPGGVYAPQFGGNRLNVSTCQDCHMRAVTGRACVITDAPIRNDLPLHDMTGGSAWMAGVIATMYPADVDAAALQDGAARARYMLQNAATLGVEQQADELVVSVTNESGHKLPTGYPEGRRIWINVVFRDAGGAVVAQSGAYDAATGELTHDAGIKVYEAKPGLDEVTAPLVGVDPGPSFHFVLNNRIFKDSRIPPRGFTNAAFAAFGGAPVAYSYADGQFWDETTYSIPPDATSAEVRLLYQSTSKEYVEFLRDENTTNSAGQVMYDAWVAGGRCPPELMRSQMIALTPPSVPGDVNGDGHVTLTDLSMLLSSFGACSGQLGYNAAADFDDDGCVNLSDLAVLLGNYGT